MNQSEILARWLSFHDILPVAVLQQSWHESLRSGEAFDQVLIRQGLLTSELIAEHLQKALEQFERSPPKVHHRTTVGASSARHQNIPPSFISHFDRYEILEELSRGGMGVVYKAREIQSGRELALKVLLAKDPSPMQIERFVTEGRALAQLSHPNILKIHDLGHHQGRPYLATEWIRGRTLTDYVREHLREHGEAPDFQWIVRCMTSIAEALRECHDKGLIHRDLKPDNVLIEDVTERAILVDFGLVHRDPRQLGQAFESLQGGLTKTGETLGTPAYMAPEQVDHKGEFGEIGSWTDVWGFGATLYHTLTSRDPIEGTDTFALFAQLVAGEPLPSPSKSREHVPPWLDSLCHACLTRESQHRPSVATIIDALRFQRRIDRRDQSGLEHFAVLAVVVFVIGLLFSYLRLDRQPPTFHIIEHPSHVSGQFRVRGSVQDKSPSHLLVRLNGRSKRVAVSAKGHFSFTWHCTREGHHELLLVAYDKVGHESPIQRRSIVHDELAPVLTLPKKQSSTWDSFITLNGTVSEDSCIVSVGSASCRSVGRKFSLRVPVKLGIQELTVLCTDRAGLQSRAVAKVNRLPTVWVGDEANAEQAFKSYGSLEQALQDVGEGTRILIEAGIHSLNGRIDKAEVRLIGASRREKVVVVVKGDDGLAFEAPKIHIESLTLRGANKGEGLPYGAGLLVRQRNATLKNCILENFSCAILIERQRGLSKKTESLVVEDCLIRQNGSIGAQCTTPTTLRFHSTTFEGNQGKLLVLRSARAIFDKCQFRNNTEGLMASNDSVIELTDCILENTEHDAITLDKNSVLTMKACRLSANGWNKSGPDCQLDIIGSRAILENCHIEQAPGIAIRLRSRASLGLKDCLFKNNAQAVASYTKSRAIFRDCRLEGNGHSGLPSLRSTSPGGIRLHRSVLESNINDDVAQGWIIRD